MVSGFAYHAIHRTDGGVSLAVAGGGQDTAVDADQMLISTGRSPNIGGLGLTEYSIAVSPKGGIVVDDRMRTTRSSIYAAGDIIGHDQFVYIAAYGAKLAAKNALNDDSLRYDKRAMPAMVFTDPQVAGVGLTEAAGGAAGYAVLISAIDLHQLPRALAARDARGLIKLVADAGAVSCPARISSLRKAPIASRRQRSRSSKVSLSTICRHDLSVFNHDRGSQACSVRL